MMLNALKEKKQKNPRIAFNFDAKIVRAWNAICSVVHIVIINEK